MMGFSSSVIRIPEDDAFSLPVKGRSAPPASGTDDQIVSLFKQANLLRSCWVCCLLNPLQHKLHLLSLYRCSGKGLPVNTFPCIQAHFHKVTYRLFLAFSQPGNGRKCPGFGGLHVHQKDWGTVCRDRRRFLALHQQPSLLTRASLDKIVDSPDRTQTLALYCQKRTCPQFVPKCLRQTLRKLRDKSFKMVVGKMHINILRRGKF